MLANGRALVSGVDEAYNELCVASQLLANLDPRFTLLEYEPALTNCARSIDFRVTANNDMTLYVDVKTIKPKPKDRWDQFVKACEDAGFPRTSTSPLPTSGSAESYGTACSRPAPGCSNSRSS
jgi:hypothetical protein